MRLGRHAGGARPTAPSARATSGHSFSDSTQGIGAASSPYLNHQNLPPRSARLCPQSHRRHPHKPPPPSLLLAARASPGSCIRLWRNGLSHSFSTRTTSPPSQASPLATLTFSSSCTTPAATHPASGPPRWRPPTCPSRATTDPQHSTSRPGNAMDRRCALCTRLCLRGTSERMSCCLQSCS